MECTMTEYLGKEIPKLGFGFMRLPRKKEDQSVIDMDQVKTMVDHFMNAGLYYFDTAYVYDNGKSEEAIKEALVDRYPRDQFRLATKLNAWMGCTDEETAKQQFYTSLERTGAGYFDFYLLHALQKGNYEKYDQYHLWDFVKEQKAKGLIKHWGFSFHADPVLLEELLTRHPDVDFIQLQINYADWDNPSVESRANYEVARKHQVPVVIMEPVKGGTLANPPEAVREIFHKQDPDASAASWAIRFAASLDGIITVLSGMSTLEQLEDNISYMKDFKPLDDSEMKTVHQVQEVLQSIDAIPCTGCHYCTEGCPMHIDIPGIFTAMNLNMVFERLEDAKREYNWRTGKGGKASDCIACGQCEKACPQQIKVITRLKECAQILEN